MKGISRYNRKVRGYKPTPLCTNLVLKWGRGGGGVASHFTEFVVANARGVFSAPIAHDLDAQAVELSANRIVQGLWRFIQVKKKATLSKYFGG